MDAIENNNRRNTKLFFKKRLKLAYLLFFIVPLTYYFLWTKNNEKPSDNETQRDYLSFSVRVSNPANMSLVENGKELINWDINSKGYKNLEFVGPINSTNGICFNVKNLYANDTLSFFGINLYSNNKLFSLGDNIKENISVANARIADKDGVLILIVEKSECILNINLKPPDGWGKSEPFNTKKIIIACVFLLIFLSVFAFNPSAKYFILSLIVTAFLLLFAYYYDLNLNKSITLLTSSNIKNTEVFYNHSPFFSATKKYTTEKPTDCFSQPLNFETEKYLRFDIGDSLIQLEKIKIKINTGVFSVTYNLSVLAQEKLMLNDMVLIDDIYYVTGNDPYVKLTSAYFIKNLDLLLFLEKNVFLFLSLIVFLLLMSFKGFFEEKVNALKLKPLYIMFLFIPMTYHLVNLQWNNKSVSPNTDQLYFSVRTSRPSVITLINGKDSLTSWGIDSKGFKYVHFKGNFNLKENFFLKVSNLSINDTVSFLSINIFHNNEVHSLFEKNNTVCKIKNADYIGNTNDFNMVVTKQGAPATVSLMPSNLLKTDKQESRNKALIIFITFCAFVLVLKISPNQVYFSISCLVTSIMMVVFFWICYDIQSQLVLKTTSPAKRLDFFYNNNPTFAPDKTYLDLTSRNIFKLQILPAEFLFYRFDIGNLNEKIKDLQISAKFGVLKNSWDYRTISSDKILLNDLIRCGQEFRVCGDDPFIALSSAYQTSKIHGATLLRQNLFFFLAILLFVILIVSGKYCLKGKRSHFFLVVFFLTLISTGLIVHLFNTENSILLSENRRTKKFPTFQLDSADVYTKELDNYILDQLSGRKYIIRLNNLIQYSVFKQLVNNQVIHFGKDGWMFFVGGITRENYENRQPLTNQELKKLLNVLEERNEWLKKRGIRFYMIFPPMSQTVYEEHVGQRMRRYYKQTKTEQLFEYLKLNSDLDVIDLYTPLVKAKKTFQGDLYFKNSCHWSFFGGYIAYCTMINYIKNDFPNIGEPLNSKDFKWVETSNYKPDLLKLMDIDVFYSFKQYKPLFFDNIITDTIYPFYLDLWTPKPPASVITKRTNYPSMLMYGDSYAGSFLPFLARNFSKTTFIWTPLFQPLIIEKEKPDMVIQEMVDVSIVNILLKNKPFPELKDTIPGKP